MAAPVEPVAGKFAVFIFFFFGTFRAGLSSVFPCMLIAPIHLADYQSGELDTISKQFRIGTFMVALVALLEPILGSNPTQLQILSQVFIAFVLPLVVLGIIIMIRKKDVMNDHVTEIRCSARALWSDVLLLSHLLQWSRGDH